MLVNHPCTFFALFIVDVRHAVLGGPFFNAFADFRHALLGGPFFRTCHIETVYSYLAQKVISANPFLPRTFQKVVLKLT